VLRVLEPRLAEQHLANVVDTVAADAAVVLDAAADVRLVQRENDGFQL
jgi:hypothetical protein